MNTNEIKKILILGAGTMGQQISIPCALSEHEVIIYDVKDEALEKSLKTIPNLLKRMVCVGQISNDAADRAMRLISITSDPAKAAINTDLISESIPEDPILKGKVFAQFNELCPPHTIFTTNTSTLLPSMFAEVTGRPDKFLAFHFHDVPSTTIVDIMPHVGTSTETIEIVTNFAKKIGMFPIVLTKENYGYVFNTMLTAVLFSALTLASNEVATIEDIDRSWIGVTHMTHGPFGIIDHIGVDTVWKIANYWAVKRNNPQEIKNAELLKKYIDKKYLGEKTQRGFYEYPNPTYSKPNFITNDQDLLYKR